MGRRQCAVVRVEINPKFWNNRKVFITGHTGFKGSWLCLMLRSVNANICGYSLPPPSQPNLFESANIAACLTSIHGDIRNHEHLHSSINKFQPQTVIHLAAQSLVRESYTNPLSTYDTNVMGTINVLEGIRKCPNIESAVIVTSDKCYENKEWHWPYRENEALGGHDPYSSSKACVEILTASYRQSFFDDSKTGVASVRAGNVIGGGDWAKDRLIPSLLHAIQHNYSAQIRNPHAIRPWQHVLEPLSGYLKLAEQLNTNKQLAEAWNFGPSNNENKAVSWIADHINNYWGNNSGWTTNKETNPHEAHILNLDSSKARTILGWKPTLSIDEALQLTVLWHKAFLEEQNMQEFTLKQIKEYTQKMDKQ
ncbi:MAG: CDP-glucose 4,6-dehydratase [Gammaproteobacteria bacterium]|nr:CDP-glucose 4,6-dehydratase [Gammaproteobacteria bacterium]